MWEKVKEHNAVIDLDVVNALVSEPRGIATPVSKSGLTLETFVASSRHVENRLPEGANWNGKEELLVTAEEYEAARRGTAAPKKAPAKKPAAKVAAGGATGGAQ